MVKYEVALTKEEHYEFMSIIGKGSHSSRQFRPWGFCQWSLRLLADKMVEMEYIESIWFFVIFGRTLVLECPVEAW